MSSSNKKQKIVKDEDDAASEQHDSKNVVAVDGTARKPPKEDDDEGEAKVAPKAKEQNRTAATESLPRAQVKKEEEGNATKVDKASVDNQKETSPPDNAAAAVKKEDVNDVKQPQQQVKEEEVEARTPQMVAEWLGRLKTTYWEAVARYPPPEITIIIFPKSMTKDGVVPNEYWDQQTVTIAPTGESKRWGGEGRLFCQGRGEMREGHEVMRRGPEGDAMWLLGIERGNTWAGTPPPMLTNEPSIKGDLYAMPCDPCLLFDTYGRAGGQEELEGEIRKVGCLPGPFTGPNLTPIVKEIYTFLQGEE